MSTAATPRRPLPFFQIDAFTDRPYTGNPAAVVWVAEDTGLRDAVDWMQRVAAEMNLSETAFVSPPRAESAGAYRLRWFTPRAEVELCGHGTLATALALIEWGHAPASSRLRFETTHSGELAASVDTSRATARITLDFPLLAPSRCDVPGGLAAGLRADAGAILGCWMAGTKMLVELPSAAAVRALDPEFGALKGETAAYGYVVTAAGDAAGVDYVNRFFAPAIGIKEDPVTGSAHCGLAPFWAARLGRLDDELVGVQESRRGGTVRVRCRGERVDLIGSAVITLRGEVLA